MPEKKKTEFITEDIKEALKEAFRELRDVVNIEVFTKDGMNDMFNELAVTLTRTMSEISDKVKATFHSIGDEQSRKRNVHRSPSILIEPERYNIRYTGSPAGEEGRSFVMAIIMASTGKTLLTDDSKKRLNRLKDKRHVRVFVSPT